MAGETLALTGPGGFVGAAPMTPTPASGGLSDPATIRMLVQMLGATGGALLEQGNPAQKALAVPGKMAANTATGQAQAAINAAVAAALDPKNAVSMKTDGQKTTVVYPHIATPGPGEAAAKQEPKAPEPVPPPAIGPQGVTVENLSAPQNKITPQNQKAIAQALQNSLAFKSPLQIDPETGFPADLFGSIANPTVAPGAEQASVGSAAAVAAPPPPAADQDATILRSLFTEPTAGTTPGIPQALLDTRGYDPRAAMSTYYNTMANLQGGNSWFVTPEFLQQGIQNLHQWEQLKAADTINMRNAVAESYKAQLAAGKPTEAETRESAISRASSVLSRIRRLSPARQADPMVQELGAQAIATLTQHKALTPEQYAAGLTKDVADARLAELKAQENEKTFAIPVTLPDGRRGTVPATGAQLLEHARGFPALIQNYELAHAQEPRRFPTFSSWVKWVAETEGAANKDMVNAYLSAYASGRGSQAAKIMSSEYWQTTAKTLITQNPTLRLPLMQRDAAAAQKIAGMTAVQVATARANEDKRPWIAEQLTEPVGGHPVGTWFVGIRQPDGTVTNEEFAPIDAIYSVARED